MTGDPVAFLRERLDEDESTARGLLMAARMLGAAPSFHGSGGPAAHAHWERFDPTRVLAEVDAKRRIIAEHATDFGDCRVCAGPEVSSDDAEGNREWSRSAPPSPCQTLRLLALPYQDHAEYQADWAPES